VGLHLSKQQNKQGGGGTLVTHALSSLYGATLIPQQTFSAVPVAQAIAQAQA
jgi:hypothetical protein